MKSFAHLHCHSEYSALDGAARVDEMVAAAAADNQPALAITDHGGMWGVVDFYKACERHGVKPIPGNELYMAKEDRRERPQVTKSSDEDGRTDEGEKAFFHLTALAETNEGYKNLVQLSSRAYLTGYYRKPRVDWELLDQHSKGLIVTSGCLGGQVLQALLKGRAAEALKIAGRLQDIFGKDNFFIEVQNHGIPDQLRTMPALIQLSKKLGAPLLATQDSHYISAEDAANHDILLCVQTRSAFDNPDRFRFESDQHYMKTAAEMWHLFDELPEACENTLRVAERVDVQLAFNQPHLPAYDVPEGFEDVDAYLTELVFDGAEYRWGDKLSDEIISRLAYELKIVRDMGLSSYFLIMWDIVSHAREQGIRTGPGRGSAGACALAYCLRITDLDPIKYDLPFERFLNPSRVFVPDEFSYDLRLP